MVVLVEMDINLVNQVVHLVVVTGVLLQAFLLHLIKLVQVIQVVQPTGVLMVVLHHLDLLSMVLVEVVVLVDQEVLELLLEEVQVV